MRKSRAIAILLIFLLTISCNPLSEVHAAKTESTTGVTKEVVVAGKLIQIDSKLSNKELSLLTPDIVTDINPTEGVVVSVSQTETNLNNSIDAVDDGFSVMNVISPDILKITVVVMRMNIIGLPSYDRFKITAIATWTSKPYLIAYDSFAIAWSDDFTLYSDKCTITRSDGLTEYGTRSTCEPEVGVGFDIPMCYITGQHTREWAKKAKIEVYVKKLDSIGTANVVASYAHETLSIFGASLGISLSANPSVGFVASVGIMYEAASPAYEDFLY